MKVMVTGATGFIGNELIKNLNARGHEIVVLTRNSDSARLRIPVHCEIVAWDPCEKFLQPTVLKGIDAVINLAGENIADGRWSSERKRELINSRVLTVRRLIDAISCMDRKPQSFVSASAIGFYGNCGDELLNEVGSKGHGFLSDVCRVWEDEILKANDLGLRTVAYRIGMVLGHDGGALSKILPPFKLGIGGRLGNGTQWMSWIHVQDLVDMLVYAIENPSIDGVYNAVSPNPVRNSEFTKTLGKVLKRPTLFPIPKFVLKTILGELSELLLVVKG